MWIVYVRSIEASRSYIVRVSPEYTLNFVVNYVLNYIYNNNKRYRYVWDVTSHTPRPSEY